MPTPNITCMIMLYADARATARPTDRDVDVEMVNSGNDDLPWMPINN